MFFILLIINNIDDLQRNRMETAVTVAVAAGPRSSRILNMNSLALKDSACAFPFAAFILWPIAVIPWVYPRLPTALLFGNLPRPSVHVNETVEPSFIGS